MASNLDNLLLVSLVIFLAVFTQSLTGFGSALVAMALLPALIGIRTATPLVALVGLTIEIALLLRYHAAFRLQSVWRLIVASLLGVPLGLLLLRRVDERLALVILGCVLVGYAVYALLGRPLPSLKSNGWAYGTGFVAGMLGGAYNTSGPPVVIYGDAQRWPPAEFKSNLQGFFLVINVLCDCRACPERKPYSTSMDRLPLGAAGDRAGHPVGDVAGRPDQPGCVPQAGAVPINIDGGADDFLGLKRGDQSRGCT